MINTVTIKIEPGKSYKVELDDNNPFIIVNNVLITDRLLYNAQFLQSDVDQKQFLFNNGVDEYKASICDLYQYVVAFSDYYKNKEQFESALYAIKILYDFVMSNAVPEEIIDLLSQMGYRAINTKQND